MHCRDHCTCAIDGHTTERCTMRTNREKVAQLAQPGQGEVSISRRDGPAGHRDAGQGLQADRVPAPLLQALVRQRGSMRSGAGCCGARGPLRVEEPGAGAGPCRHLGGGRDVQEAVSPAPALQRGTCASTRPSEGLHACCG